MAFFSFFKKKPLFTEEETKKIVEAIRQAEMQTSGEVRVYIEGKNPYVSPMDRAMEIFDSLEMEKTEHRNGVLLYIAFKHHEVALIADEGIYQKTGPDFWNNEVEHMLADFKANHLPEGIVGCVSHVGQALHEAFPYNATEDKNELPDDIVFGKL